MRKLLAIVACLAVHATQAQPVHWHDVVIGTHALNPELKPAPLSTAEQQRLRRFILGGNDDGCAGNFSYFIAPLGRPDLIYISPGPGCFRSGQGENASLWIVARDGPRLHIIGTPYGWGLGIQPHLSHGLHDFVTGWHDSAFAFDLRYYRFDGTRYRRISSNTARACNAAGQPDDSSQIFCLNDGKPARESAAK